MAARSSPALAALIERLQLDGAEPSPPEESSVEVRGRLRQLAELEARNGAQRQAAGREEAEEEEAAVRQAEELAVLKLRALAWEDAAQRLGAAHPLAAALGSARDEVLAATARLGMRDLGELRCLARPPGGCLEVCAACGLLLENSTKLKHWRACQEMLRDREFVQKLRGLRPQDVGQESLDACSRLLELEFFNAEYMNRRSLACGFLVTWVRAFLALCRIEASPACEAWRRTRADCQRRAQDAALAAASMAAPPAHSAPLRSAVADLPHRLGDLKSREKRALLDSLPSAIVMEASTVAGGRHSCSVSPEDTIAKAKEKLAGTSGIPALCQVWSCGAKLMGDTSQVWEFTDPAGNLRVTLLVSMEEVWASLQDLTNERRWRCAVHALAAVRQDALAQLTSAFLNTFSRQAIQEMAGRRAAGSGHARQAITGVTCMLAGGEFSEELAQTFGVLLSEDEFTSPGTKTHAIGVLEELALAHQEDGKVAPVLRRALTHVREAVQRRAMEALSRLGDGQLVPALVALFPNTHALRALAMLGPGCSKQRLALKTEQQFGESHVQSVLNLLERLGRAKQGKPSAVKAWAAGFDLVRQLLGEANDRVMSMLLSCVEEGFEPAIQAATAYVPAGSEGFVSGLDRLLDSTSGAAHAAAVGSATRLALVRLRATVMPGAPHPGLARLLCACLDDREVAMRVEALELAAELPAELTRGCTPLRDAVAAACEGDWPAVRLVAQRALAQLGTQ